MTIDEILDEVERLPLASPRPFTQDPISPEVYIRDARGGVALRVSVAADRDAVIAAVNHAPALVAEVRRLRAQLATLGDRQPALAWRRLTGDEYKSKWCALCPGSVWAHWERADGFAVCGEFHCPENFC